MLSQGSKKVTVSSLCRRLKISRQSFYQRKKRERRQTWNNNKIIDQVNAIRINNPRMGSRKLLNKIKDYLHENGIKIGRDRFFDLLRAKNLLIKKRKSYQRTTNSFHHFHKYKNTIRDSEIVRPNQVWVSDLTYIKTCEGFLYLSLVSDLYSRKILGYEVSDNLETIGCLRALKRAFKELLPDHNPTHHSDRGIQYCSKMYVNALKEKGCLISMTEDNHCYENAVAERINGILKDEYFLGIKFKNKRLVKSACKQAIYFYNTDRPHLSLNMRTPDEVFYSELKRSNMC